MGAFPISYERINVSNGFESPSTYKSRNNKTFNFWVRALYERVVSCIDFNFPKEWNKYDGKDLAIYGILRFGWIGVVNHDDYGIIGQPCSLCGTGFNYQPTNFTITNPAFSQSYEIGKDGEIIHMPGYTGVFDIIHRTAEQLSNLDNAINQSINNSRFAFVWGSKNKAAAQTIKEIMDLVNRGESAVFYKKPIPDDPVSKDSPFSLLDFGNIKDKYLTPLQLQDIQTILAQFNNEIGICNVAMEKKERLITSEVDTKNEESQARITVWCEKLNECCEIVNEHFGTNMSIKVKKEVIENVSEDNNDRTTDTSEL